MLFDDVQAVSWGALSLDLPVLASLNAPALAIALLAALALFRFKLGMFKTLGLCSIAGLALRIGLGW